MNTQQNIAGFLTPYAFEMITVSDSAIGFTVANYDSTGSLSAHDQGKARVILVQVQSNPIRYRFDGSNPVATSSGYLATAYDSITFSNYQAFKNFRAIREEGSDAKLAVTYLR